MNTPRQQLLDRYNKLLLHEANEAETRLKVINRILYDVLGWTDDDVSVEEHVSEDGMTTFADYVIRTGMTALVIEAKKAGRAHYEVPATRHLPLNRKLMETETGEAIQQARDYARKLSIPFAAVTNGSQWIVFPATRIDQIKFEESAAIIFQDLNAALSEHFKEFSGLLSRSSVIDGSLENELLGRIENQLEQRRLNAFFSESFSKIKRSNLYHLVEDTVSVAFSDDIIRDNPSLLEKIYVRTPERIRFDSRIQMHIAKRETPSAQQPKRPMKERDAHALSEKIQAAAAKAKPVAVLILGTVGAGKTTFLNYTRDVAAHDKFRPLKGAPYPHWIYIDFRQFAPDESAVEFIYSALKSYIQTEPYLSDYDRCLRHAYRVQIDALMRGALKPIANNKDEIGRRIADFISSDIQGTTRYVDTVLSYAAQNAPIFLVIDNIDQFEAQGLQPQIFSTGIALAQRLRLNLILSLRDATYVTQRTHPVFDAFDFDPIYIDPPGVEAVLSRRFFVAKQLLSGKSARFTAENGAEVTIEDSAIIIDLIQSSVLGTPAGHLIDVLATSDIRLALRMTREFLQFGYTATGRALKVYHETGKYNMPLHEAIRAILLGNQSVYSDRYSVLGNPFDAKLARTEYQLLRLYVIAAIVNLSTYSTFQYCSGAEVERALATIGFGNDVALHVLQDLCKFRFLHTQSHSDATLQANFVPTRLGGYVVRQFTGNLTFLENAMMDTFISDGEVWQQLRALTDKIYSERDEVARLKLRVERNRVFFLYMRDCYTPLRDASVKRGLPKEWCSHPLAAIELGFEDRLKKALYSAEINYPESSEFAGSARRGVTGTVRWFDIQKGFGFIRLQHGADDAFLPKSALKGLELKDVVAGTIVTCDVVEAERGLQASNISIVTVPSARIVEKAQEDKVTGVVKFYDAKKNFGFITPDEGGLDIFVQAGTLKASGISTLLPGQHVRVAVSLDASGPRTEILEVE